MKHQSEGLLNQITDLKQRHEIELIEMQAKTREFQEKKIEEREIMHKEEVAALTQEWHVERKSAAPLGAAPPKLPASKQELLHHNQLTMDAVQSGLGKNDLGHQVILLTREIEDLKEKHRLEMAELAGQREMSKSFLPQPLIAAPDGGGDGDNIHHLELINLDLQAQVNHLQGELARTKIREKELLGKLEDHRPHSNSFGSPPSPGYFTDGTPSGPLLTEPTQLEYLRNILYMYMMGRETKTLTRVIGTVVQFSEDQMKQLIAREEKSSMFGL